jgi:hypothetical protein
METEAPARPGGRPRPLLLVALAITVGLALMSWLMPGKSAVPVSTPSNPRPNPRAKKSVENVQPGDLEVHLEALKEPRPEAESAERNPFRFYVKPAPPPPPPSRGNARGAGGEGGTTPVPPVIIAPPSAPPIPLKYIGLLEDVPGKGKIAAFSDCRSTTYGREGEIIAGQYRLVHIGTESVVMEYVDGRGRTTIRQSGQDCVGK